MINHLLALNIESRTGLEGASNPVNKIIEYDVLGVEKITQMAKLVIVPLVFYIS